VVNHQKIFPVDNPCANTRKTELHYDDAMIPFHPLQRV